MEKVKVVMESLNLEPCLQGTDGTIFSDLPLYEHRGPGARSGAGGLAGLGCREWRRRQGRPRVHDAAPG